MMQGAIAPHHLQRGTAPFSKGLVEPGNVDPWNRPVLHNQDGSYSTTSSFSREDNGLEVLVPSVINGKRLSENDAWTHYKRTGEHLGKFSNPDDADRYAETLHETQAANYDDHGNPLKENSMQGAIQAPMPQTPAAVSAARFVRRPDGGYLDTKTGAVYPNEESLPKGALDAPQGAIDASTPAAARPHIGPLDIARANPTAGQGAIGSSSWGEAPLPSKYAPPIQIPKAPPGPGAIGKILSGHGLIGKSGIGGAPPQGMPPLPAQQGAIDTNPDTWLGNLVHGKGILAPTSPAEPGSVTDYVNRAFSGQGVLGKPAQGAIAPPATAETMMPPKPLAATPAAATVQDQGAIGGADSGPAVPSMPMPSRAQQPAAPGALSATDLAATSAGAIGSPASFGVSPETMAMGGTNAAKNGVTRPQAGAIDPNAVQDALAMHSAPGAGAVPITPVANVGGIDAKAMQDSLPSQAEVNAQAQPEAHEGDFLERLGGKIGIGDGTSTMDTEGYDDRNNAILKTGLAMMAAGGQPGATLGGSLGQGGLYASEAMDKEKDRREATAWRKTVFNAEQSNKKSVLNLDIAKWLTGEKHQERQDSAADTRNQIADKAATARSDLAKNTIATSGQKLGIEQQNANNGTRRNQLTETQQGINNQRLSIDARNMLDSRAEQDLSNGKRALATEVDPGKRDQIEKDALRNTALRFPQSSVGKQFSDSELSRLQTLHDQAVQKKDQKAADETQGLIAKLIATFYPDVKDVPGK